VEIDADGCPEVMFLRMTNLLPISAIVPTRNRSATLGRLLKSLAGQSAQPAEMIVVDASEGEETKQLCEGKIECLSTAILYSKADEVGAAVQRNQAMIHASHDAILFLDDDIVFEDDCVSRLWEALQSDARLGGVNAMITNQRYTPPGIISRSLFRILTGKAETTYAGKCIGPALNLLPEDRDDLPAVVPVEWLNLGCTLYRREALPRPPFSSYFTGYSLMEDVALSLTVGKKWKLANARTARIFHDSQSAEYKKNKTALARMELINRHYVMTRVLGRRSASDLLKLALLESFGIATSLASTRGWPALPAVALGKLEGVAYILSNGSKNESSDRNNHSQSRDLA
jgi:glycosyltransferase involved in cell wall biosynthesis